MAIFAYICRQNMPWVFAFYDGSVMTAGTIAGNIIMAKRRWQPRVRDVALIAGVGGRDMVC